MKKLVEFIIQNYPEIMENHYLLDHDAHVAIIKNGTITIVHKYVYNSRKGNFIRIHTGGSLYIRVYIDAYTL